MKVWIALIIFVASVGIYFVLPLEDGREIVVETPKENPVSDAREVSTSSASLVENKTVKIEKTQPAKEVPAPNVKSTRVDLTYDSVNAQLTQLLESVDVATLNLVDCEALDWQISTIFSSSDLLELEGIGLLYSSDVYAEYNNFERLTLAGLATSGDFTAQQVYASQLLRSLETFDDGLKWAHLAIARGSKAAILDIYNAYFNLISKSQNPNKKQRESAMKYRKAYDYFRQYRDGVKGYLPDEIDANDAQIEAIYTALFHDIHNLRASLDLPEFVNRGFAFYPPELSDKCSQLNENEIKLQKIESGNSPLEF